MAKFTKQLLEPGSYETKSGPFPAPLSRMRRWVDRFKAMKQRGIAIPICWGHQPKAKPATEEDRKAQAEYYKSRFNASYIDDLKLTADGKLEMIAETPPGFTVEVGEDGKPTGSLVNTSDGTRIKEVSLGISDWKDGKGQKWPDSIIHVALTPLPVWHKQDGFKPVEAATGTEITYLSLSGQLHTLATDEEPPMADEKDEGAETETPADGGGEGGEGGGEGGGGNGTNELLNTVMGQLEGCGIKLPEMTGDLSSFKTFLEHLHVALTAFEHAKAGGGEEGAEGEEGAGGEGATAEGGAGGAPAVTQEQPAYMSLATIKDPGTKVLFEREQKRLRSETVRRIEALKERGLPVVKANKFIEQAKTIELSLTQAGDPVPSTLDAQLALLEEVLPAKKWSETRLKDKVKEERQPDFGDGKLSPARADEVEAEFLKNARI